MALKFLHGHEGAISIDQDKWQSRQCCLSTWCHSLIERSSSFEISNMVSHRLQQEFQILLEMLWKATTLAPIFLSVLIKEHCCRE